MERDGGGQSSCLRVCSEEGSLSCLSLRWFRGIFTGTQLSISDSCGISDPFLLGIDMHINKHISKDAWRFMPGTRLGDAREEG